MAIAQQNYRPEDFEDVILNEFVSNQVEHLERPPDYESIGYKRFWTCMVLFSLTFFSIGINDNVLGVSALPIITEFALPHMMPWLASLGMLGKAAFILIAGKVNDEYDDKYLLFNFVVLMGLGHVLSGTTTVFAAVLVGRVLAGVGSAFVSIVAVSTAVRLARPSRRPLALTIVSVSYATALKFAPLFAGLVVEHSQTSWRWCFLMQIPIIGTILVGILTVIPHSRIVPREKFMARLRQLSFGSMLFQGVFLVTLILPLALGGTIPWTGAPMILCYFSSPVSLACFLFCDFRATTRRRLLSLEDILHNRQFAMLGTMSGLVSLMMSTSLFYIPMLLEITWGLSSIRAGLLIIPSLVAGTIINIIVTRIHSKTGQYVTSCRVLSLLGIIGSMSMCWLASDSSMAQLIFVTCLIGMSCGGMATVAEPHLLQFTDSDRLGTSVSFTTLCMVLGSAIGLSSSGNLITTLFEHKVIRLVEATGIDPSTLPEASLDISKVLSALRQNRLGAYTSIVQKAYLQAFSSITLVWAATSLAVFLLLAIPSTMPSKTPPVVVNEDEYVDCGVKVGETKIQAYMRSRSGYNYF